MNRISCKLSDLVEVKNGSTPSTTRSDFYDGNIVWITPKDLSNNKSKFIYSSERKITKAGFDSCSTSLLPIGSVLLSSRAPIGLLAICAVETCTNQGFKNLVVKKDKLHNEYLYYWLKTKVKYINSLGTGTTFKEVSKGVIENLLIELPKELKDQQKIASVLSALDSKIELNNRINAELEAMAKTLYDYWFVQFDFPDKNGKPYKTSGGKMVWNEELKREIPEGWEVDKINKKVIIGSGFPFNSDDYNKVGTYKVITIKNVQDGFLDTSSVYYVSFLPNNISEFCILKEVDILMSLTGNVGRMCFVDQNNLLLNQRVGKLIGEKDFVVYSYFFFKRPENQQRLSKIANGSSQANLSPIEAVKDNFAIPPKKTMNQFSEIVNPMINQILSKNRENQKLTELRDWLLPMLMNGQVKVKDEKESLSMAQSRV